MFLQNLFQVKLRRYKELLRFSAESAVADSVSGRLLRRLCATEDVCLPPFLFIVVAVIVTNRKTFVNTLMKIFFEKTNHAPCRCVNCRAACFIRKA